MSKSKKIVICLISLIILAMVVVNLIGTKAYAATNSVQDLIGNNTTRSDIEDEGDDEDEDEDEDEDDITENENTNISENKNINNSTNKNNTNTGIPYTGLDNSVTFVIIALGISAVFAYKKIRDYKNI